MERHELAAWLSSSERESRSSKTLFYVCSRIRFILNSNETMERIHMDWSFPRVPRAILFPHQPYVFIFAFNTLTLFKWKLKGVIFFRAERFGLVDMLLGSGWEQNWKKWSVIFLAVHATSFLSLSTHVNM